MKYKRGLKTALVSLLITAILLLPQYAASYNQLKEIESIKYELFACFREFWALVAAGVSYASRWFVKPWTMDDRDKRALGILQLFLSGALFYVLFTYRHDYFEDSIWNVIYYLPGGILRVLISVCGMLLMGTDWRRVMNWWREEYPRLNRAFSRLYLVIGPILSMVVLELLAASKVDGMLHRFRFITVFY